VDFLKTDNVYFLYDEDENDTPVLRGVSLSVKKGEYVAIIGHNGSGKSTLAKIFNLILDPTEGALYYLGKNYSSDDITDEDVYALRSNVGMVFQNPDNQIVATVVEEDVAFGAENLGLPREEIRRRVVNALNVVGMQDYARHAPHKLSGGQKQRVAIAGIIAMKPRVIIFDESTAMLDPIGRKAVIEIMEKLNREENITVINITHYMEEAARADRVIVINDGEMILDGAPEEVFSKVDLLHSIGLESPQSTELVNKLRSAGFDVDIHAIGEEECLNTILSVLDTERER